MTLKKIVLAAVAASVTLSSANAGALTGRGASFPGPVYKAWTSNYFKTTSNMVNYTPT
ncbi:MAG: phosphate transporter substrate-binding protein PstS, partial [Pseudomonadota bacterium]